jgi:hypothetical protein
MMTRVWIVTRTDDNGNTFDIMPFSTPESAERCRVLMEERGHKQLYQVREDQMDLPPDDDYPF